MMGRKVRRVPLGFNWPLNQPWSGYVRPDSLDGEQCPTCRGDGYSPHARLLRAEWYGKGTYFHPCDRGSTPFAADHPVIWARAEHNCNTAPNYYGTGRLHVRREAERLAALFNSMWCHHLNADDVAALLKAGRLIDFTHTWDTEARRWIPKEPPVVPTPQQVNTWSIAGFGHDSINASVVIEAECARRGWRLTCEDCDGHGDVEAYPGQRADAENWQPTDPPEGDGWQLWETITEGSPISPVFDTAQGLARWLTTTEGARINNQGEPPMPLDVALAFVMEGWAPTGVIGPAGPEEGACHVGRRVVAQETGEQ